MDFEHSGGGCCHGHHQPGWEGGHHGHHPHGEGGGHHGGCCSGHGYRHFYSHEEVIAHLEGYLKELQAEAKAVEEQIDRLRKGEEKQS